MSLTCTNLSYMYSRGPRVLQGVSCGAEAGRVMALIGPNGAGKSTLLKLMAGLLTPTSGTVTLTRAAAPPSVVGSLDPADRARHVAYVAQRSTVAFAFTARQVVAMGRHALQKDVGAVNASLEALELMPIASRPFNTLSAGQQQRVSLARALAQVSGQDGEARNPRFLLADEPLAALDPKHAVHALDLFRSLARSGVGVVLVMHDLSAARWVADDALLLGEGGQPLGCGSASSVISPVALERAFGIGFEEAVVPGRMSGLVARGSWLPRSDHASGDPPSGPIGLQA